MAVILVNVLVAVIIDQCGSTKDSMESDMHRKKFVFF